MDNPKVRVLDRGTGEVKEMDPAAAQAAFLGGQVGISPGEKFAVSKDGEVGDVPAERLQEALQAGWTMASKQDLLRDAALGAPALAAAEGAASALTFGGSTLLQLAAGGDREAIQARSETPAAKFAEGTANVLGIAATLGAGALAKGAGVGAKTLGSALVPAAALDAAGTALGARATAAASGAGLSSGAAKLVGWGAKGATEGVVAGGLSGVSEEALGNPEANAETLLSAGAWGALLGGAVSATANIGLGKASDAIASRVKPVKAASAEIGEALLTHGGNLTEQQLREYGGSSFARKSMELMSRLSGATPENVSTLNSTLGQAVAREGEGALRQGAESIVKSVKTLNAAVNDILGKSDQELSNIISSKLKASALDAAPQAQLDDIGRMWKQAREEMADMSARGAELGLGRRGGARAVQKAAEQMDALEDKLFASGGMKRKYNQLVEDPSVPGRWREVPVSRSMDDLVAERFGNATTGDAYTAVSNLVKTVRTAAKSRNEVVAQRMTALADQLDAGLNSADTWGEAATLRAKIQELAAHRDDALAELVKRSGADKEFDSSSADRFLRTIKRGSEDPGVENLNQVMTKTRDLLADMGEDTSGLVRDTGLLSKELGVRISVWNAVRALGRERAQIMAGASNSLSYAAGSMLGGPLRGVGAGAIIDLITDPGRAAIRRARIGTVVEKRAAQMGEAITKLVNGSRTTAVANMVEREGSKVLEGKTPAERNEATRARIDQLVYSLSPEGAREREDNITDFREVAPRHADVMEARRDVAARLLMAAIPQPIPMRNAYATLAPQYSEAAMRKFGRMDRAIQDPQTIIHDAMKGVVTDEAKQVLHTVYPELAKTVFQKLQERQGHSPYNDKAIYDLLTPPYASEAARTSLLQGIYPKDDQVPPQAPGGAGMTNQLSQADTLLQ